MQDTRREMHSTTRATPGGLTPSGLARRLAVVVVGCIVLTNTACYTYGASPSVAPQAGERVAVDITDHGRLTLGDQLGKGVARVEGLVNENQGDSMLLSVTKVGYLNAPPSNWSGERIRITPDAIARVQERHFSKGRTLLTAGIVIGASAAFILTRSLVGGGKEDTGPPPRTPPGDSHRIPVFAPGLRLTIP